MNNQKNIKSAPVHFKKGLSSIDSPLVTIGITNYNGKDFLDQCIESILNQTIKAVEIIIVDDNSVDGSLEIIKVLESMHENIRVIYHMENSGSPDLGRKEILASAKGKYLMFVDSDDYFAETYAIEKFLEELVESPELDYVYCNMRIVDREGNNIGTWCYKQYSDNELILDTFQRGGSGVIPMKGMFKRSFFTRNNLSWHSNETAGDTLSALIYTSYGWRYKHLELELLCYRQYDESFTFNIEKRIKAILNILDYILDNFSEEIYFPKIPWMSLSKLSRYNVKNYLLGQFYFELLKVYYAQWSSPSGDRKPLMKALLPLKDKILFYLEKWEASHHIFDDGLRDILKKLEDMFQI